MEKEEDDSHSTQGVQYLLAVDSGPVDGVFWEAHHIEGAEGVAWPQIPPPWKWGGDLV